MFSRATINLSANSKSHRDTTGVRFQVRFSFRSKFTSSMVMLTGETAEKIGIAGELAQLVEVAFGEGDDWGKIRLRRTEKGEVSNSIARPLNGKNKKTFCIPLGQQAIFVNQRVPSTSCEWKTIQEDGRVWIEIVVPKEAMNYVRKTERGASGAAGNSRKEILAQIAKMSV